MHAVRRLRLLLALAVVFAVLGTYALTNAFADQGDADAYEMVVKSHQPVAYWRMDDSGPSVDATGNGFTLNWMLMQPTLSGSLGYRVPGIPLIEPNRAVWLDAAHPARPRGRLDSSVFTGLLNQWPDYSFSVEAWVKLDQLPSYYTAGSDKAIVSSRGYSGSTYNEGYMLYVRPWATDHNDNRFTFDAGAGNVAYAGERNMISTDPSLQVQTGRWYHVVATVEQVAGVHSLEMHLYVDGQRNLEWPAQSVGYYEPNHGSLTTVGIGDERGTEKYPFTGSIDEVAIYDRALSPQEVAAHYAAGTIGVAPINTAIPTVSGSPGQHGSPLSVSFNGSWLGRPVTSWAYQWVRCDGNCSSVSAIYGATGATYYAGQEDVGHKVIAQVTATNSVGSTTATSAVPANTVDAVKPSNTTAPTIATTEGAPFEDGQPLTASEGVWAGTRPPATWWTWYYRWLRCDSGGENCLPLEVEGSAATTYTLTSADIGSTVVVDVTASNIAGSTTKRSAATPEIDGAPPSNLTKPFITGPLMDGQGLTADKGSWKGTGVGPPDTLAYTYQWLRCDGSDCAPIGEASPLPTYTLASADVGKTIRVEVEATNGYGFYTEVSDPTSVILPEPLENESPPVISGEARDGQTLSTSNGEWDGTPPAPDGWHYQWYRCEGDGAGCDPVGDNSPSYTLTSADYDHRIKVEVTGTNGAGPATEESALTDPVLARLPYLQDDESLPIISGVVQDGRVLSADPGIWLGTPTITYSYRWVRCDEHGVEQETIVESASDTYTVTAVDVGHTIRVWVTATNAAGSAESVRSTATGAIEEEPLSNTSPPTIVGNAQDGQMLSLGTIGDWEGTLTHAEFSYRWLRCDTSGSGCAPITGATGTEYLLESTDVDHKIALRVTGRNSKGPEAAVSDPSDLVAAIKPFNIVPPSITGIAKDGSTLRALEGVWAGSSPSFTYQWHSCDLNGGGCSPVAGATGSTYALTSADVERRLTVYVTASNEHLHQGGAAMAQSSLTSQVLAIAPLSTGAPAISGIAKDGETLKASDGSWTGSTPFRFTRQWLRCDLKYVNCSAIAGANSAIHVVTPSDVGRSIRFQITATNGAGQVSAVSEPTTVVPTVSLRLVAENNEVSPGEEVRYRLEITNETSVEQIPDIEMILSTGFGYKRSSIQGGPAVEPAVRGQSLTWAGVIGVSARGKRTINVGAQAAGAAGAYHTTAVARLSGAVVASLSNAGTVTVLPEPKVTLDVSPKLVAPGDVVRYTISVENLTGLRISVQSVGNYLPSGFSYVLGTATGPSLYNLSATGRWLRWRCVTTCSLNKGEKIVFNLEALAIEPEDGVDVDHAEIVTLPYFRVYGVDSVVASALMDDRQEMQRTSISRVSASRPNSPPSLLVATVSDLALYYRPILRFDSSEPWRPLNIRNFLKETFSHKNDRTGENEERSHFICRTGATRDWTQDRWWGPDCSNPLLLAKNGGIETCEPGGDWTDCTPALALQKLVQVFGSQILNVYLDIDSNRNSPEFPTCDDDENGRLCDKNDGPNTAIYYHAVNKPALHEGESSYLLLDYWMYYRWNTPHVSDILGIAQHEGDWEHVVVANTLFEREGNSCLPHGVSWVGFSAHGHTWMYSCGVLQWANDRVQTYVANGTHAMYPRACAGNCKQNGNHVQKILGVTVNEGDLEGRYNGKASWGRNKPDDCDTSRDKCVQRISDRSSNIDEISPKWAFWGGKWGASVKSSTGVQDSPRSPTTRPSFSDPETDLEFCARTIFDEGDPECEMMIEVPNVKDQQWKSAKQLLTSEAYGFKVKLVREPRPGTIDDVFKTSPAAGSMAKRGSTINVYVRDGLLDVRGMKLNLAAAVLAQEPWFLKENAGERIWKSAPLPFGTVIDTIPHPGSSIRSRSEIRFVVSLGGFSMTERSVEDPWRTVPETPSSEVNKLKSNNERATSDRERQEGTSKSNSPSPCDRWFGPYVVALACDEATVRKANKASGGEPGTFLIEKSAGLKTGSARGLAQVVGMPLKPGASLTIAGTAPRKTRLALQIENKNGVIAQVLFGEMNIEDGGRAVVRIKQDGAYERRDGVPDVRLETPKGIVRPARILTKPRRPRILKIKRVEKGFKVRFVARAPRTVFQIWGAKKRLSSRVVKLRIGRRATILIKVAPEKRSRYLVGISISRDKVRSSALIRKVPAKRRSVRSLRSSNR